MKKTITYAFTILFLALSMTVFSAEKIKVACMGNSITAGFYNYPTPLGAMLGDDYDVRSFGKGGSGVFIEDRYEQDGNYSSVYERTQECKDALAFKPNIVIIKLGTNDCGEFYLCQKNFWYTDCVKKVDKPYASAHFKADYMSLIEKVKALPNNPKIYLCYPVHLYPKGMFGQGASMNAVILEKMHPVIDEIAREQGFEVIDLHTPTLNMEENFPDGCHPNHQGSYIIAKAVYKGMTGKTFEEKNVTSFVPELKTPYCIINKYNGKVLEVTPFGTTYRVSTTDFVKGNTAQQFTFENLTHDVFRIKTTLKNVDNNPYYLSIPVKSGNVVLQEIGLNWGVNDNLLSVQVLPKGDGYYTMGLWKENSYMGVTKSSVVVKGGKTAIVLSDYDEWSIVKTSEVKEFSHMKSLKNTQYDVMVENGNSIMVKNVNPSAKVVLYNVFGQVVYSMIAGGNQIFIPVSKGFYVLTIDEGKDIEAIKVIVQ